MFMNFTVDGKFAGSMFGCFVCSFSWYRQRDYKCWHLWCNLELCIIFIFWDSCCGLLQSLATSSKMGSFFLWSWKLHDESFQFTKFGCIIDSRYPKYMLHFTICFWWINYLLATAVQWIMILYLNDGELNIYLFDGKYVGHKEMFVNLFVFVAWYENLL